MIKGEKYVDFNGKHLNLLGYVFCQLQVEDQFIEMARILGTSKGSRSIIGRKWVSTLRYKFEPVIEGKSEVNSFEKEELCEETKKFVSEFKKLFTRNGKVKKHQVKINLNENANFVQQKERQIPIQLQHAVDAE